MKKQTPMQKFREEQEKLGRNRWETYVTDEEKEFLKSALRGRRLANKRE